MERQLRMGGGIMNAVPREQYGLGSFLKKGFNKLKGGVKKIAKSPFGKAAALYFGGNLLQGNPLFGNPFGASNPFQGRITDGIGSFFRNTIGDKAVDKIVEEGGDELFGMGKSFLVGSLLPSVLGGDDGDGGGYQRDIPALRAKLTDSYRNQKTFSDEEDEEAAIAAQVEQDIAGFQQDMNRTNYATGGGRIGYNEGTDFQKWLEGKQKFDQGQNAEQLYREYLEDKRRQKVAEQKTMAANGGRIGFNQGSLGGKTLFGDIAEIDWGKEIKDIPKNLMDLFSPSQIMDILSQAGEGFKQIYFNLKSDSEKEDLLKKIMGEDYEKRAYGGRIGFFKGAVAGGGNISPGTKADYKPGQGTRDDNPFTGGGGGPKEPQEPPKTSTYQKIKALGTVPIALTLSKTLVLGLGGGLFLGLGGGLLFPPPPPPPVKGLSFLTFPFTSVPGDILPPPATAPLKKPTRPPVAKSSSIILSIISLN